MFDCARFRSLDLENSLTACERKLGHSSGQKVLTYIFMTILINSHMDCAKRASANLLLYHVLVYPVFRHAIVLAGDIFRVCVERLLGEKVRMDVARVLTSAYLDLVWS